MNKFYALLSSLVLKAKKGTRIKNQAGLELRDVGVNPKTGKPIRRWVRAVKPEKKEKIKNQDEPAKKRKKKNEQPELNFKPPKAEEPKSKPKKEDSEKPPRKPPKPRADRVDPFKETAFYTAHQEKLTRLKNIMGQGRSDDIKQEMKRFIGLAKEKGSYLDNKKGFDTFIEYWENQDKWNKLFAAEERGEQVEFFKQFPNISKELIENAVKNGKRKKRKGKGGGQFGAWDLQMLRLLYQQYGKTWFDKISEGVPVEHGRDRLDSYIEPSSGKSIKVARPKYTQLAKHDYVPSLLSNVKDVQARGGKYAPLPHQMDAANLAVEGFKKGNKSFLLADGTGGGKTISALTTAAAYLNSVDNKKPVFIVTESDIILRSAWMRDAASLGLNGIVFNGRQQSLNQPGKIVVTTYSQIAKLSKEEIQDKLGLVIFDEAHNLKTSDSETHKVAEQIMNTAPHTMLATATPVDKLDHVNYILKSQGIDTSLIEKELLVTGAEKNLTAGMSEKQKFQLSEKKYEAAMKLGSLFNDLTKKGLMVKREVPMDDMTIKKTIFKPTNEQLKLMNKMMEDYKAAPGAFGGMTSLRRMYEQFKIDQTLEYAEKLVKEGKQVLIFAESVNDGTNNSGERAGSLRDKYKFKGTLPELGERLKKMGIPAEGLYGGSPTEAVRTANGEKVKKFQEGKIKVVYGNADTMGTGLSFDDEKGDTPRVILMMTPPYSAMDFVQVIGRINRLKTKSKSTVEMIGMDSPFGIVDDWMNQLIADKVSYLGSSVKGDVAEINLSNGKSGKFLPQESGTFINIDNYRKKPTPMKLDFSDQNAKKSKNWDWFLDELHKGIEKKVGHRTNAFL